MANEKLSYEIAALYTGQPAIKAAFDDFAKLNSSGAKVVSQLQKIGEQSKKTGEQIRESRQGAAQLGMQFNQLATQVASGTSPLVAFQQQLGDVGYALSFSQGKLGAFGRFLAGPWGALVIAGTGIAAALWSTFKEGPKASASFESAMESAKDAAFRYAVEVAKTREEVISLYEAQVAGIRFQWQKAATDVARYGQALQTINRNTEENKDLIGRGLAIIVGGAYKSITGLQEDYNKALEDELKFRAQLDNAEVSLLQLRKKYKNEDERAARKRENEYQNQIDQAETIKERLREQINLYTQETTEIGKAKNKLDDFVKLQKDLAALPGGAEFLRQNSSALSETTYELWKAANGITAWNDVISKMNEKPLPEWKKRLNDISTAYGNLSDKVKQTQKVQSERGDLMAGVAVAEIDKISDSIKSLYAASDPLERARQELYAFQQLLASPDFQGANFDIIKQRIKDLSDQIMGAEIVQRNEEMRKSFESIGNSVDDAFKKMLTAGGSWRDGMRSIIQSVIDQLWKMYVTQQIVGMVTGAISGLVGGGMPTTSQIMANSNSILAGMTPMAPGFANGTNNAPGGMAWVGERGPELVNLPRGSQVIPAHRASQMSGGGVTVNVDARGSADPAAVRAQVQQGILEAAPAIIAAAESRTISSLRRPRLGGAVQ